jgi:hypothetical protein
VPDGKPDYARPIRKLELPAGFDPPTRLRFEDIEATTLTRDDLADDVRGINASLAGQPRGREQVTGAFDV